MIVFDGAYGQQIADSAGCTFNPVTDRVIARVEQGRLLGGMIYSDYAGASITMHTAGFSPRWLSRDTLWAYFNYPFNVLGCKKIIVQIRSTNTRSLEFCSKIGCKREAIIRDVFPDGDLIVMGMYRDDCRWLKLRPRGNPIGTSNE